MSDVRTVFTTAEAAEILGITPSYLLRLVQSLTLSPADFRSAGKRNYLFRQEAVEKLKNRNR